MKRFLTLILCMTLLLCLGSACAQSGGNIGISPLDSDYFTRYGTSLASAGNGNVEITFSCSSVGVVSQLGVSTYTVQRLDTSGWTDVTGLLTGSTGNNVSSYSFSKLFHGVVGETYRVTCTFICTKSDGTSETKAHTSLSVTAKASKP